MSNKIDNLTLGYGDSKAAKHWRGDLGLMESGLDKSETVRGIETVLAHAHAIDLSCPAHEQP
jgi:hypothetical protein